MSSDESLAPELQLARFGRDGKADRFIGFWLEMAVEGRQAKVRLNQRRVHKSLEKFFADQTMRAATSAAGPDAVAGQLREAAAAYFTSCLTDPSYSTLVWGMSRLTPEQVRGKAARDAVDVLAVLAATGPEGQAADLPGIWVGAFEDIFGEPGLADLRAVMAKRAELAPLAASLGLD